MEGDLEIVPNCLLIWTCNAGGDKALDTVGHTGPIAKNVGVITVEPL